MKKLILATAISSILIGCGGGGGGSSSPSNPDQPTNPDQPDSGSNYTKVRVTDIDFSGAQRLVTLKSTSSARSSVSALNVQDQDKTMKENEDGDLEDIPVVVVPEDDVQLCVQTIPNILVVDVRPLGDDWSFVYAQVPTHQLDDCGWQYSEMTSYIVRNDGTATYPLQDSKVKAITTIVVGPQVEGWNESNDFIVQAEVMDGDMQVLRYLAITLPEVGDKKLTMREMPYLYETRYAEFIYNGQAYLTSKGAVGYDESIIYDNLNEVGIKSLPFTFDGCRNPNDPAPAAYGMEALLTFDANGKPVVYQSQYGGYAVCFGDVYMGNGDANAIAVPDDGSDMYIDVSVETPRMDGILYSIIGRNAETVTVYGDRGEIVYTDGQPTKRLVNGELKDDLDGGVISSNTFKVRGKYLFEIDDKFRYFSRYNPTTKKVVKVNLRDHGYFLVSGLPSYTIYEDRVVMTVVDPSTDHKHFVEFNFDTEKFTDHGVIHHGDRVAEEIYPL